MGIWEEQQQRTKEYKQLWIERQDFDFSNSLFHASNEEEVKVAYIREFSLPVDTKERHDLRVNDVLFEFKYSVDLTNFEVSAKVIAQAIYYINRLYIKGRSNEIKYLIVADKDEARIFRISEFEIFYKSDSFDWKNFRPSSPDPNLINAIKESRIIESNRTYRLSSDNDLELFSTKLYKILFPRSLKREVKRKKFKNHGFWIGIGIISIIIVLILGYEYLYKFSDSNNSPVNLEQRD